MRADAMKLRSRIQAARRLQDMTQTELARRVGVQRSAVSHWESPTGKSPTVNNLRKIAKVTGVGFEWLATGRGRMTLSSDEALEGMPVALAELIDDDVEIRLIRAFREAPAKSRLTILEMTEQIAALRTGKRRSSKP
jgi:transcriptional regulator with XRE-family HTH domain